MTDFFLQTYFAGMAYLVWASPYIWETDHPEKHVLLWELAVICASALWPVFLVYYSVTGDKK